MNTKFTQKDFDDFSEFINNSNFIKMLMDNTENTKVVMLVLQGVFSLESAIYQTTTGNSLNTDNENSSKESEEE